MLRRLAHRLVSIPPVYRLVQRAFGRAEVTAVMRGTIAGVTPLNSVLDVGSSSGTMEWEKGTGLVHVDIDYRAIRYLTGTRENARAAVATAASLPFGDRTFTAVHQYVACLAVPRRRDG